MFVVDVLQHDIEPLTSIVKMLNDTGSVGWREFWPNDFTVSEVLPALKELIRRNWVEVLEYSPSRNQLVPTVVALEGDASQLWFRLTNEGREAWQTWEPPVQ